MKLFSSDDVLRLKSRNYDYLLVVQTELNKFIRFWVSKRKLVNSFEFIGDDVLKTDSLYIPLINAMLIYHEDEHNVTCLMLNLNVNHLFDGLLCELWDYGVVVTGKMYEGWNSYDGID